MGDLLLFSHPLALLSVESGVSALLETNEQAVEHGLALSPAQALEIVRSRNEILTDCGRVEFSFAPLQKIARAVAASPYVGREEYGETICAFTELFYAAKNETREQIGDDALIDWLAAQFDGSCRGSLELLQSNSLDRLVRAVRSGMPFPPPDEDEETGAELDEDEEGGDDLW